MNKLTYIDDCRLDQFIFKKLLSRYGSPVEVQCLDTAIEALIRLKRNCLDSDTLPDIILLDIYNPFLDAWNFLDRLQAIHSLLAKPVEVYVLSASKYPTDVERLKQYDFVKAYIVKPVTRDVLERLVREKELAQSNLVNGQW